MFFLNTFTKIFEFRIMTKKFLVNGYELFCNEKDFDNVCKMFKENVTIDDLECRQTEV